jgi:N-acetylmuramoyl-L-alanine amidase
MRPFKALFFILGITLLFFIVQYEIWDKNSWNSWNLPLSGKVIVLDPGHGGPDGGAVGGKTLEKDISLNIALATKDYLQEQGALVILTREDDRDLADKDTKGYSRRKVEDLKKRLEIINESQGDLYLSIHLNAIPSPNWRGAQTFFHGGLEENEAVAKFIQAELKTSLSNTSREAKIIQGIYLVKHAKIPGALVEVGFLSNTNERALLETESYQQKVAEAIYRGINRYFTEQDFQKE